MAKKIPETTLIFVVVFGSSKLIPIVSHNVVRTEPPLLPNPCYQLAFFPLSLLLD